MTYSIAQMRLESSILAPLFILYVIPAKLCPIIMRNQVSGEYGKFNGRHVGELVHAIEGGDSQVGGSVTKKLTKAGSRLRGVGYGGAEVGIEGSCTAAKA